MRQDAPALPDLDDAHEAAEPRAERIVPEGLVYRDPEVQVAEVVDPPRRRRRPWLERELVAEPLLLERGGRGRRGLRLSQG